MNELFEKFSFGGVIFHRLQYTFHLVAIFFASSFQMSIAGPIEDLPPGHWLEIPNSKLRTVTPNPEPEGRTGVQSVIIAWSGAALDTARDRLLIWGGGHGDYSGNEIYAFDLNTLSWDRITNPSTDVGGNEASGVYPDGNPRSQHTYDTLEYIPSLDSFCSFGARGGYPGVLTLPRTDCFNLTTMTWEQKADSPNLTGHMAAYDPVTGHVWARNTLTTSIAEFDPINNTWKNRGSTQYVEGQTAEIDPIQRKLVAVGSGEVLIWDISKTDNSVVYNAVSTSGGDKIVNGFTPGITYDSVSQAIIGWNGGAEVYKLNLASAQWARINAAQENSTVPTSPDPRGTYGRFRYVPSKNVFIVVNSIDQNVFIYKMNDIKPAPPQTPSNERITITP